MCDLMNNELCTSFNLYLELQIDYKYPSKYMDSMVLCHIGDQVHAKHQIQY